MPGKRYRVPRGPGGWPVKAWVDPGLRGLGALDHPAVARWHRWLLEEYRPRARVALLTPCSNVKPYPRSPQSGKVRGVLRRLGLWDSRGPGCHGAPRGVEWLYLSDLLVLVPYERAHLYPACCYELSPDEVLASPTARMRVARLLAGALERLSEGGVEVIVAYLPGKHRVLLEEALTSASRVPRVEWVPYSLFHGHRSLEEALTRVITG